MPHATSSQRWQRLPLQASALALAGCAGWLLRSPAPPAVPEPPSACAAAPQRGDLAMAPLVLVGDDGLVSLQLQRMPLPWVLEQLAAQARWPTLKAELCGPPAQAAAPATVAPAPLPPQGGLCQPDLHAQPAQVLQALASGAEEERWRALMVARGQGLPLGEQPLRQLFEQDSSARVRMAAFDLFMERLDTPQAAREAVLHAVLALPHPELREDAAQRLRELAQAPAATVQPPFPDP